MPLDGVVVDVDCLQESVESYIPEIDKTVRG